MDFAKRVSTEFLCDRLLDENQPISERFRAFSLSIIGCHPPALNSLIKGTAAESLGAFGLETSVPVLETSFQSDPSQEVRDTYELALTRIRELKNATPDKLVYFEGFEPALPVFRPIPELREVLLNEDNSLYERCSALFTLQLLCLWPTGDTEEAFSAVIESLGAESPILRHHIAYCLAQLADKKAFHAVSQVLQNASEHPMVRLKAVDALHSIAEVEGLGSTTYCKCVELLKEFAKDPEPIVSQSCEVALRGLDFLGTNSSFRTANVSSCSRNLLRILSLLSTKL